MANIVQKAVGDLLEQVLTASEVIAVRAWQPASMYEVDVYLPKTNLRKWDTIRRLKCKVGVLKYRDYTPALWNAETKICTLFIEAGHDGTGARWVQQLKAGDEILLGEAHAAQLPAKEGRILCLGDGSSIGHFLALKQLTNRAGFPMEGTIFLHDNYHLPASLVKNNPEFAFILKPGGDAFDVLTQCCAVKDLCNYTSIYIAGNMGMVKKLRTILKASTRSARIYAHGFWS